MGFWYGWTTFWSIFAQANGFAASLGLIVAYVTLDTLVQVATGLSKRLWKGFTSELRGR